MVGLCLLLIGAVAGVSAQKTTFPPEAKPLAKAEFIFFSNAIIENPERKKQDFAYLKRFRVCLTNGYATFTGSDLAELKAAGCELFLYFWFNGYYERELARGDNPNSAYIRRFPEMVSAFREIHRHPEWLLNPNQALQGAGAAYPAYFYDYQNPAFRRFYIGFLRDHLAKTGYNGLFFDYIGSWALPEEVKRLWKEKYPSVSYDEAGIRFLKELRRTLPEARLFGNQAYRLPAGYYTVLDYDISESHGTSFVWGSETHLTVQGKGQQKITETFYRLWDGPAGYREISRERRARATGSRRVRVYDINYLQPRYAPVTGEATAYREETDRAAIFYSYALAKLTDAVSYASDWYAPGLGRDDLYFVDLGRPVTNSFDEQRDMVVRYFEKGFVVVTRRAERTVFTPDSRYRPAGTRGFWDLWEGKPVPDWPRQAELTLEPTISHATKRSYPVGRVYLYRRGRPAAGRPNPKQKADQNSQ
jgi:hypothetical protein